MSFTMNGVRVRVGAGAAATNIQQENAIGYLTQNNPEQALKIAKTIPCTTKKSATLQKISTYYLTQNNLEKAFEIANTIPNIYIRNRALDPLLELIEQSYFQEFDSQEEKTSQTINRLIIQKLAEYEIQNSQDSNTNTSRFYFLRKWAGSDKTKPPTQNNPHSRVSSSSQ